MNWGIFIKQHNSGITALDKEEQIIKDADKLWRFSKKRFLGRS